MSQSSQIISTQDINDISDWGMDTEMEPVSWAYLVSTTSALRFYCEEDMEYSMGRDTSVEFCIPKNYVSSKHCSIFKESGAVFVKDFSTNGTYIARGKQIKKIGRGKQTVIKNGDKIILIQQNRTMRVDEISFTFVQEVEDYGPEDYFIGKKIGAGAFATVHMGNHKRTLQPVAIKVIKKKKLTNRDAVMAEANILKKIQHEGVVRLEAVCESEEDFFLVLELVTGGELYDFLKDQEFLSENNARPLIKQLLEAMRYLHDNDIVHRDLKLENILLNKEHTHIKISDFGLSRVVGEGVFMKTMCGTPEYLAPEILDASCVKIGYGSAVDMWAVGVIIFTLLCGFFPFEPENDDDSVFQKVASGKFAFPSDVQLSREAKDLIRRLLQKDVAKRYTAQKALRHPWVLNAKMKARK